MSFTIKVAQGTLKLRLKRAFQDPKMYKELSNFMRDRIYKSTKRGYYGGVRKNLAKFKPLSPGYVEMRKQALKGSTKQQKKGVFGKKRTASQARKKAISKSFGAFFSPKKSNLTYTGQLLDALKPFYDARKQTMGVVVKASGRKDDSGLTNKQLAEKVTDDGRPFPTIDVRGINTMVRKIQSSIRRSLRGTKRR